MYLTTCAIERHFSYNLDWIKSGYLEPQMQRCSRKDTMCPIFMVVNTLKACFLYIGGSQHCTTLLQSKSVHTCWTKKYRESHLMYNVAWDICQKYRCCLCQKDYIIRPFTTLNPLDVGKRELLHMIVPLFHPRWKLDY